MSDQQHFPSPAELSPSSGTMKRKNEDDAASKDTPNAGQTHTRKRNRYISIACNECKRRKIKCNGNTPCQRCGNLNLDCQYAPNCCTNGFRDSEEFRLMNAHLTSLQDQVNHLYANLNALRSGPAAANDGLSYPPPPSESPVSRSISHPSVAHPQSPTAGHRSGKTSTFRGPTSSFYHLNVAKNTLQNMGYQDLKDSNDNLVPQDASPRSSPIALKPLAIGPTSHPTRDPLWSLNKDEVVRLCRVYEENLGDLYPVVNMEQMIIHGTNLYEYVDSAMRNGLAAPNAGQEINDDQSNILKMVLACALTAESNGDSELGRRLFDSVRGIADRALHSEVIDINMFPILILVAIYHYHADEEPLAWRINGQIGRMCFELGLHRREMIFSIPDERERNFTVKVFWSIYVLDRRWSFGTGMPPAMQDADIDPDLPEPKPDEFPYLNAMISFAKMASKLWRGLNNFDSTPFSFKTDDMGFFDYQVQQWQKTIPPELQLPPASAPQTQSRLQHRLQILLYLRANQARILSHRPVLHSASSIQENMPHATRVVEVAKDSIRALTHLNQTTDIYRRQQVCFNYFLMSALAVIFLASCHAPVQFSPICRDEFYMALDLVKGFSTKSWVSKRLWRAIKGLKEVGPKLGLSPDSSNSTMSPDDPHSSAALAMAGLAGHEMPGLRGSFQRTGSVSSMRTGGSWDSSQNGFMLSSEMTNLFEAALGSGQNTTSGGGAPGQSGTGGYVGLNSVVQEGAGAMQVPGNAVFGGDEHLYRHVQVLF